MTTPLTEALAAAEAMLTKYVHLDTDAITCLALWAAHTWISDEFDTTPYIHVSSPEPMCGKTRLLEVLMPMVREPLQASAATGPTLFRSIEEKKPTVFVDEADQLFVGNGNSERLADITAVLNLGYRRGATVPRLVPVGKSKFETRDFGVYSPKIIAGIRDIPGPLESRCIPIKMKRKLAHQDVARYRPSKHREDIEAVGVKLAEALAGLDKAEIADDAVDSLTDRQAECWEPLLVIARAAGDENYRRALAAAEALHAAENVTQRSPQERILEDVLDVWPAADRTITSNELVSRLAGIEDAPWGDWFGKPISIQAVTKYLQPYGLRAGRLQERGSRQRAWSRSDFEEVWKRYLPDTAPHLTLIDNADDFA